jgi:predicted metal-dependent peptidase
VQLAPLERLAAEPRRRWAAGRIWAAHQAPYLASALLALDPVVVDQSGDPPGRRADLSCFPVDDRWHVYLDPEVLSSTEVRLIGFWLIHQVSHLLRRHADRFPVADRMAPPGPLEGLGPAQRRWNLATDAEVNDDLVAGEAAPPPAAVTPAALGLPDALTAEDYWDALGGEDAPAPAPSEEPGPADCGGGVDGQPRPWDTGSPGLGSTDRRLVERDVAQRIREHQRSRGDVPAGWQRFADGVLEPTVSWQRLLASALRRGLAEVAGRVDFTYRKPSRRSAVTGGVVLPSLRQPLPKVAMVLDTSGSMDDRLLAQALGEVGGVLRALGVGRNALRVVCCDAQAFEAQRVMQAADVRLLGGGGTDMGAGLAAATSLRPRPDLIVVLTDGHTPWPPTAPPRTRVVVGLMDPTGQVPGWASVVRVGEPAGGIGRR